MKSINYDILPTKTTQAEAFRFQTNANEWKLISQVHPGAACFSSYGQFFDNRMVGATDISIRFAMSSDTSVMPLIRLCPINYPAGVQHMDHTWPIATKSPSYNPQVIYQNLTSKWNEFWDNPVNSDPSTGGIFMTLEVSGSGYIYISRMTLNYVS